MTTEQKDQIIEAAKEYIKQHDLSQSNLAEISKVNARYISEMFKGNYATITDGKEIPFKDQWYNKIANAIGYAVEKQYWHRVETAQYVQASHFLLVNKANGTSGMLIGATGLGKTEAVEDFLKKHPNHNYRLTVSKLYTLPYIIERLLQLFGLPEKGSPAAKLDKIIQHLIRLKWEGAKVSVIFDEAENFKMPIFGMVKALFDGIGKHCSIMLIGTPELEDKMEKAKRKGKEGMPQFCRRFKAGTRRLKDINPRQDYKPFYAMAGIEDEGLIRLLNREAENYGELHDYLEPALREADRMGVALDEQLFRLMYDMPDLSKLKLK